MEHCKRLNYLREHMVTGEKVVSAEAFIAACCEECVAAHLLIATEGRGEDDKQCSLRLKLQEMVPPKKQAPRRATQPLACRQYSARRAVAARAYPFVPPDDEVQLFGTTFAAAPVAGTVYAAAAANPYPYPSAPAAPAVALDPSAPAGPAAAANPYPYPSAPAGPAVVLNPSAAHAVDLNPSAAPAAAANPYPYPSPGGPAVALNPSTAPAVAVNPSAAAAASNTYLFADRAFMRGTTAAAPPPVAPSGYSRRGYLVPDDASAGWSAHSFSMATAPRGSAAAAGHAPVGAPWPAAPFTPNWWSPQTSPYLVPPPGLRLPPMQPPPYYYARAAASPIAPSPSLMGPVGPPAASRYAGTPALDWSAGATPAASSTPASASSAGAASAASSTPASAVSRPMSLYAPLTSSAPVRQTWPVAATTASGQFINDPAPVSHFATTASPSSGAASRSQSPFIMPRAPVVNNASVSTPLSSVPPPPVPPPLPVPFAPAIAHHVADVAVPAPEHGDAPEIMRGLFSPSPPDQSDNLLQALPQFSSV